MRKEEVKAGKMRTVNEVSQLTGVSIRTLHYYDSIDLLKPTKMTESGYRLYDDTALERLQHILLFRELQFPLKDIKAILNSSSFDRNRALEQQITLLKLRKEHLENLITFARGIQMIGVKNMDFSAFDTRKIDEYAEQAKATWGQTKEYQEMLERSKDWTKEDEMEMQKEFMDIFVRFGAMSDMRSADRAVQEQVEKLQTYITEHFYDCTPKILQSLGRMYTGGGSLTENINQAAGMGTAEFVAEAIEVYCRGKGED